MVAGEVRARRGDADVTICDLTGTGAQDTAIATLALAACRAAGVGSVLRT